LQYVVATMSKHDERGCHVQSYLMGAPTSQSTIDRAIRWAVGVLDEERPSRQATT
jgi:hypothetical protein